MFFKSLALWAAAFFALACATAAPAQTLTSFPLRGSDGSTYPECAYSDGSKLYMCHLLYGWTGSAPKAWTMDANGYGGVNVFSSVLPTGAATAAAQATENQAIAADVANNAAFQGEVQLIVGTADSVARRSLKATCTAAGNVSVIYGDGSVGTWQAAIGIQTFPIAITTVSTAGTTATCTYANLK